MHHYWRDRLGSLAGKNPLFAQLTAVCRLFAHLARAKRRPALAQAVKAPLICWSFNSSMLK